MKITISFPDDVAERVCRRADRDEFVSQAVAVALELTPEPTPPARPSKWARLVARIDQQDLSLGSFAPTFDRARRELRRNLSFASDEP